MMRKAKEEYLGFILNVSIAFLTRLLSQYFIGFGLEVTFDTVQVIFDNSKAPEDSVHDFLGHLHKIIIKRFVILDLTYKKKTFNSGLLGGFGYSNI